MRNLFEQDEESTTPSTLVPSNDLAEPARSTQRQTLPHSPHEHAQSSSPVCYPTPPPNQPKSTATPIEQLLLHTPALRGEALTHIPLFAPTLSPEFTSPAIEQTSPLELNHTQTSEETSHVPSQQAITALAMEQTSLNTLPTRALGNLKTAAPSGSPISTWIKSEGWTNLKGCLHTLSCATNLSALGPLKTVIEGIQDCVGIYEDAAQGRQVYTELRAELERIFKRMQHYLDLNLSATVSVNISAICSSIQQEIDRVKGWQTRTSMRRFAEAEFDKDNILECYRRIRNQLQDLSLDLAMSTLAIVERHAMDDRLRELEPSSSACYDSRIGLTLKRGPCTEGTRTNVLDQMYRWVSGRDTGNIYWISGMAGTGKTTVAYSLCEWLDTESNRKLGASFFCSRSLPECRNVGKIVPSIAFQLARYSQPFQYALCQAMKKSPDALTKAPGLQFDSLLLEPLSDPEVRATLPASTVVVIDALDECEDITSTRQILDVLSTKCKDLRLKFVVSSRPEAAIRDQMEKNGTWVDARVVLHELDSGEVQTDIRTYLQAELSPISPPESAIEKLVERAGVLFIYAATVIRYVGRDNFKGNPRARLQTVLDTSRKQSKVQTKEIDQLYQTVLEAAVGNDELDDTDQEDIQLILNTAICARAPLTVTVEALNSLLMLNDIERVNAALRPLWSVLHVMAPQMTVATLHTSFSDYLTDPVRSGKSKWHCNAAEHNYLLAKRCFEYIRNTSPQFNICQLESSYLYDSEVEDLDARVQKHISIELRYACQFWSAHLDSAQTDIESGLSRMLECFLTRHLLLWLEVMNLIKRLSATPFQLVIAKQWTSRYGTTRELATLLEDAVRFALTIVSSPLSQSTPHIYVSMLPFLPSNSPIRKHYSSRMQGMISVNGTALDRRKALLARWPLEWSHCAANSPDGTLVAMAPDCPEGASSISLADVSSGQLVRSLSQRDVGTIFCLAFSPNGTYVAAGTYDAAIWIWDLSSGQLVLGPLVGHKESISSLTYSHDGSCIISGSYDHTIYIWDAHSGRPTATALSGHTDTIESIATSSADIWFISGSSDKTIRVWDMRTGCLAVEPLTGHISSVKSVAISPNDRLIVSGSWDKTVRVWDSLTGQTLIGPLFHQAQISLISISPDSTFISAGLIDGTVQIWDATSGKPMAGLLKEHQDEVSTLSYSSDGTRLIVYSKSRRDGMLYLFDALSAAVTLDPLPGHTKHILSVDISPDGRSVISGSTDMTLCIWDLISGQLILGPLTGHTEFVHHVRYSQDGNRILSCSWDRTLRQWNAQTGDLLDMENPIVDISTPLSQYRAELPIFISAAYSPDSRHIATISESGNVCLWDSTTGEMVRNPIDDASTPGKSVHFSSDGTTIIAGWRNGAVRLWNVENDQQISGLEPYSNLSFSALTYSSSHLSSIVANPRSDNLILYQRNTPEKQIPIYFEGHTNYLASVHFSHDGTRLVSGSADKTMHIWDVQTGTSIFGPLRGHTQWLRSVVYSPDDTRVASASDDATIRIWNASTEANSSPTIEWVLNEDGWVTDGQSQRMMWVPLDMRGSLMWPRNTMMMSHDGYVRLDFDGAIIGEAWTNCWLGL